MGYYFNCGFLFFTVDLAREFVSLVFFFGLWYG